MSFKISQLIEYSFVHIIAQHRSGSTALHSYVMHPWPWPDERYNQFPNRRHQILGEGIMLLEHLSEPFNDVENFGEEQPESLAEQTAQAQALCRDIKQHTQNYTCMKNLIDDIRKFDEDTQDMLFNLPGITVGLYREDTFAQTCSDCISWIFRKPQSAGFIKPDQYTSIDKKMFLHRLVQNLQQKQLMHSLKHRFDVMVAYEEIEHQFPSQFNSWKNPPHSHTIINYDKVVAWYNEHMALAGLHNKVTHKGINFIIDKTMQHKA